MRTPEEHRIRANGVDLAVFEWQGTDPHLPALFLVHATGFHARLWDATAELLPEFHIIAPDMRGHGRSEKPDPPYPWVNFAEDVADLARVLDLHGAIGAGHSKGGYAVARAAARVPGAFAALLLIDPVVMAREMYAEQRMIEHFAAKRRDRWASADEMYERFANRPPFSTWDPRVLRDYCDYGLLTAADGDGLTLACPPAIEAATYAGSAGNDPYDDFPEVEVPVRILRAKQREGTAMDMSGSPTTPELWKHFPRGEDSYLPEYSHFLPMESPRLISEELRALANRAV